MNFRLPLWIVIAIGFWLPAFGRQPDFLAVVDIDRVGPEALQTLKAEPGLVWWVELGDRLLVRTDERAWLRIRDGFRAWQVGLDVSDQSLHFVTLSRHGLPEGSLELVRGTRFAVVSGPVYTAGLDNDHCRHHRMEVYPFEAGTVLSRQGANMERRATRMGAGTAEVVAAVDGDRWFSDVVTLSGWSRWTGGNDILDARDWLVDEFSALADLEVSTQTFQVSGSNAYNVVAFKQGTTRPDDWYIVGAHYDSRAQSGGLNAPGAEDNGSGTAAVLEMARALAPFDTEASIVFICYSGEEQGLHGSNAHVFKLINEGNSGKVQAALIMDMIAYAQDPENLEVLLETRNIGSFLFDPLIEAANTFTPIATVTTLFAFGSDHIPYLNNNIPALLTIENDWDVYPQYHRNTDVPANLVRPMGEGILRMNVAVLAELAGVQVAVEGGFLDYVAAWPNAVKPPTLLDHNDNLVVDVIDILIRLGQ